MQDPFANIGKAQNQPAPITKNNNETQTPSSTNPFSSSLGDPLENSIKKNPNTWGAINDVLGHIGNTLGKGAGAVLGNVSNFGSTIGTAMASGGPEERAALQSQVQNSEAANKLYEQIFKMRKDGKDTTDAEEAYKNVTGMPYWAGIRPKNFSASQILGKSADKTAEQVLGEGLGVATDIVTAGSLGSGAAELGEASIGTLAKQGAIAGGAIGGSYGISGGMQNKEGVGGTLLSGAEGAVGGAALGAAGGAIAGKLAPKTTEAAEKEIKNLVHVELGDMAKGSSGGSKGLKFGTKLGTASRGGLQEESLLKKGGTAITEDENKLATKFHDELNTGGNAKQAIDNLNKTSEGYDKKMDAIISDNKSIITRKQTKTSLLESVKKSFSKGTDPKEYKKMFNAMWDKFSTGWKGTLSGVQAAKQGLSPDVLTKTLGQFSYDDKFKQDVANNFYNGIKDFIKSRLSTEDAASYDQINKDYSDLIKLRDKSLAPKALKQVSSSKIEKVTKLIKKNPLVTAGGALGAGELIRKAKTGNW